MKTPSQYSFSVKSIYTLCRITILLSVLQKQGHAQAYLQYGDPTEEQPRSKLLESPVTWVALCDSNKVHLHGHHLHSQQKDKTRHQF